MWTRKVDRRRSLVFRRLGCIGTSILNRPGQLAFQYQGLTGADTGAVVAIAVVAITAAGYLNIILSRW